MVELLVRTVDKEQSGDPYLDRHRSGRGCVICIMPDGHPWSQEERNAPFWRIVKVPGVSETLLSQFTARDLGYSHKESEKLNRVLKRWRHALDLDALDALGVENLTLTQALGLLRVRPNLPDPAILGPAPGLVRVFG